MSDENNIDELLVALSNCYDEEPCELVIKQLVSIGQPAIRPLISLLDDDDPALGERAATTLSRMGEVATSTLIDTLNDKAKSVDIRSFLVAVLGKIGSKQAINALLTVLNEQVESPHVRVMVAVWLGRTDYPNAVEVLLDKLQDSSEMVRSGVISGLGETRDQRVLEPIIAAIEGDEAIQVRAAAVSALGNFRNTRVINILVATLKSNHMVMRFEAANALGRLGDTQATEPLIHFFQTTQDYAEQYAALSALGEIGDRRAIPILVDALKQDSIGIQRAAAETLRKLGYEPDPCE